MTIFSPLPGSQAGLDRGLPSGAKQRCCRNRRSPRSTPIATTGLRFIVRLDAEGAVSVLLVARGVSDGTLAV